MGNKAPREKGSEPIGRILRAATEVFAEAGFAGARVDEVARRAEVNKATIYYHIGDKKALYTRVIHDVFADMGKRIATNIRESQGPEEKLRTYIHNIAFTLNQHPHIPQIMMRELASGGRHFPEVVTEDFARIFGMLTEILEQGSLEGIFIDVNPFIIHPMVIGPLIFHKNLEAVRDKLSEAPEMLKKLDALISEGIAEKMENLLLRAVKK
ncbi:MAG: TetR/AcrR family transcriptional regulator [Desulfobacteraceae bacterium]|jgi:AcrR family transcriptional regulator